MSLSSRLILHFAFSFIVLAALLFIPAGSLRFWQGWAFMAVALVPVVFSVVYLYRHDPQLIERRLQSKEKISEQKLLIRGLKMVFFAAFLLPGLDYRFGWSRRFLGGVPLWLELLSLALVFGGYLFVFWVLKVNSFASRTIQVEVGQKVISDGPYGIVRHPMYSGSLLIFLAVPLALGSYFAWPVFALLVPVYVLRLLNEEKVLRQELPGYSAYCERTRFRLVPYVW
jgi:protein-S-isoprenylcysteine O-methyltransferase Ste14